MKRQVNPQKIQLGIRLSPEYSEKLFSLTAGVNTSMQTNLTFGEGKSKVTFQGSETKESVDSLTPTTVARVLLYDSIDRAVNALTLVGHNEI